MGVLDFQYPPIGNLDFGASTTGGGGQKEPFNVIGELPTPQGGFAFHEFKPLRGAFRRYEIQIKSAKRIEVPHISIPWESSTPTPITAMTTAQVGDDASAHNYVVTTTQTPTVTPIGLHDSYQTAQKGVDLGFLTLMRTPIKTPSSWVSQWGLGALNGQRVQDIHVTPLQIHLNPFGVWHIGYALGHRVGLDWHVSTPKKRHWLSWWGLGRFPAPGVRYKIVTTTEPPPNVLKGHHRLDFRCPLTTGLAFGSRCMGSAGWLVTTIGTYYVMNEAKLTRLSDGVEIPASSITISTSRDDWCWSLSATVMTREGAEIAIAGTELQANINGFVWNFLVDAVTQTRSFNSYSATVSGRSLGAWLSNPWAAARTFIEPTAKTAQQLAEQELTPDWQLNWDLPEWLIPADGFQYTSLAPVDAIITLVQAAGGMIQSDQVEKKLWAMPRWTVTPWGFATASPTVSLDSAYCLSESAEDVTGKKYNGVLVYSDKPGGIIANCAIAGTGGLLTTDAVKNDLITDITPARALGIKTLADLWPARKFQVSMPLQASPQGAGLIPPGVFFDFIDGEMDGWRGLSDSIEISASGNTVTQSLSVVTFS